MASKGEGTAAGAAARGQDTGKSKEKSASTQRTAAGGAESLGFQAEVARLLEIVAHSLYSRKEIFLRELISNASDACDRLRYAALTDPGLLAGDADLRVTLRADPKARTLVVADNGIGMSRAELISDLGTIARSGTAAFVEGMTGDAKQDSALIGQFGVGFYSAFMVADKVSVTSRKAGATDAWVWTSDGKGTFTVAVTPDEAPRGTSITLHLKKDQGEFTDRLRLSHIVKTYSDHIALPIVLLGDAETADEQLNTASALWTRPKAEIDDKQYREFYHHVSHTGDEPWLTLHNRAEGVVSYTSLIFIPSIQPFDLFHPERSCRLRLYVRRVFITDDCSELLPAWLRFLQGVIDSEDLPLNVSREMLQSNPVVAKIRAATVKRVLGELKKIATKEPERYRSFWENFGPVLKEGLYEEPEHREALLGLSRFRSTTGGADGAAAGWTGLDDYVGRMKEGQEEIFYIGGDTAEALAVSPQLEVFRARGVEVLLLTDPIDEFWLPVVGSYRDKAFRSATRGTINLDAIKSDAADADEKHGDGPGAATAGDIASLIALFKLSLGDAVKDVRASKRLTDSPVCLVADEGDLDMHLERMLRQHRRLDTASQRILEINPKHPLIVGLADAVREQGAAASSRIDDYAILLLDQARIIEGETIPDPASFSRRLADVMALGIGISPNAAGRGSAKP